MKPWIVVTASVTLTLLAVGIVDGVRSEAVERDDDARPSTTAERADARASHGFGAFSIQIVASPSDLDHDLVELGRRLFEDRRLSRDGSVSCQSCHDIEQGGSDGRRVSVGVDGNAGTVNAPTVLNAANNFAQFWNGRAASLEDQIDGPVTNPKEMGTTWDALLAKLRADPEYQRAFAASFPDGVNRANVAKAIATYERSLVTPDSRFDRYLAGDVDALSASERRGYELFESVGCIRCHNGVNVGGNSFQPFGVSASFANSGHSVPPEDLGRFNVTGQDSDKFKFKVPTLRNIDRTAPYFHDGSVPTLEDAVEIMARYQLDRKLAPREIADIVAFLHTLTAPAPE